MALVSRLAKLPRAEQWADRICAQQAKSVESIIQVGRLLVNAKADLTHGEWGRLFDERLIPLSQNSAGVFMQIAKHPLLSNSDHGQNLPPSWRTLYELTKVEPKRLQQAFKDDLITPDMPRRAVAALLPVKVKKTAAVASSPKVRPVSHLDQALEEARVWMAKWSHLAVLAPIFDAVTTLVEEVRQNEHESRRTEALEDDPETRTS